MASPSATKQEIIEVTKHWPPLHAFTVVMREFAAVLEDERLYTADEIMDEANARYTRSLKLAKERGSITKLSHEELKDLDNGGGLCIFLGGGVYAAVEAAVEMRKAEGPTARKNAAISILTKYTKKNRETS